MDLSNDLVSQFVKATKDEKNTKSESIVYGTIVEYNGEKYVKFDGSDLLTPISSTTNADDGEKVTVTVKNHTAIVTGNISSPSASSSQVDEIGSKISDFEIVIADKVSTKELDAERARIDNLVSENVTIKGQLTAANADIDNLTADNVTINEKLTAAEANITKLETEKLDASVADITYATIENLEATNADIYNLEATYATFETTTTNKLTAIEAQINDLEVVDLTAIQADIVDLKANKADIDDLTADNITFNTASGNTLDVQTLLAQFTTGENAQYLNLTNQNAVIGNAIIKDAMIDSVSVNKLTSGTINTNEINIASDDNSLKIEDGTIQFSDADGNVRLQLGEDATGDFNFILIGADGTTTLIDSTGIKEEAIADNLIKTEMINDQAVTSDKINYQSFVSGLNADGTAELIKASKVELDGTGQSLSVVFNSMETSINDLQTQIDNIEIPEGVDGLKEQVSTNTTAINIINGQIDTLVSETDVIKSDITTVSNNYSTLNQTVNSINTTVSSHTSSISDLTSKVNTNTSSITQLNNQIALKVESSDITNAINGIEIGGRNLFLNSNFVNGTNNWNSSHSAALTIVDNPTGVTLPIPASKVAKLVGASGQAYGFICQTIDLDLNTEYTVTFWYYIPSDVAAETAHIRLYYNNNGWKELGYRNILTERDTWVKKSVIFKTNSTYAETILCVGLAGTADNVSGKTVYCCLAKLEKGNKATDWSPAPEDTDSAIEDVQTQVSTNKASIDVLNNQIALKVETSDFNSLKTTVSTNTSNISSLQTSVSSNTSSIDLLNNQIALKVESSDITNAINDIEIGGRNFLLNSAGNLGSTSHWGNVSLDTSEISTKGWNSFKVTRTNYATGDPRYQATQGVSTRRLAVNSGDYITLSGWIYVSSSVTLSTGANDICLRVYDENNSFVNICNFNYNNVAKNTWTYFSATSKSSKTANPTYGSTLLISIEQNGLIWVTRLKLEKGTKPTDWTPAPEDTDSAIEDVQTQVSTNKASIDVLNNQIALKVSTTDFNSLKSTVSTNTSNISSLQTSVSSNTSSITALNNQIALKVSTTDFNSLKTTVSTNTSNISSLQTSVSNNSSSITALNNQIALKVSTTDFNSLKSTVSTNTSNISSLQTSVSSNTSSIDLLNNQIALKVESSDITNAINGIEIGSRNLALGTSDNWVSFTNFSGGTNDCRLSYKVLTNGLEVGDKLLVAFEYKLENMTYSSSGTPTIRIQGSGDVTGWNVGAFPYLSIPNMSSKPTSASGTAYRIATMDSNCLSNAYWSCNFRTDYLTGGTVSIRRIRVVRSSKLVDWTPAPEDIESDVTSLTTRVSTAESKLTPTALTTTISTAINDGTSSITTTQFVMDSTGFTVKNGGIKILNNAGDIVLQGDTNGNLQLSGTITVRTENSEYLTVSSSDAKVATLSCQSYGNFMNNLVIATDYTSFLENKALSGSSIQLRIDSSNYGAEILLFDVDSSTTFTQIYSKGINTSGYYRINGTDIISSGSSGTGNYIRFHDGTMIVWGIKDLSSSDAVLTTNYATGVYSNSSYRAFTFTFPTAFASEPFATSNVTSNGYTLSQVSAVTTTSLSGRIWAPYSSTVSGLKFHYFAIGKWK